MNVTTYTATQRHERLWGRLDCIALAFSALAWGTWCAQALCVLLCRGTSDDLDLFRKVVGFDSLLPGILGGGLLAMAAVGRRRRQISGARLLELAGLAALVPSAALMAFVAKELDLSAMSSSFAVVELAAATCVFVTAKVVSAIVIGLIRWFDRRVCDTPVLAQSRLDPRNAATTIVQPQPVNRLQDLLSFLLVLSVWFCVVPTPRLMRSKIPFFVPGASMFVAGFPVGLVGVVALLVAGLLRGSHDRQRVVGLELFGILALATLQIAAALPFLHQINGIHPDLIKWVLAWTLFGTLIGAKLLLIAIGLARRNDRLQFTLLGLLGFTLGCGALLMYWRSWRP